MAKFKMFLKKEASDGEPIQARTEHRCQQRSFRCCLRWRTVAPSRRPTPCSLLRGHLVGTGFEKWEMSGFWFEKKKTPTSDEPMGGFWWA